MKEWLAEPEVRITDLLWREPITLHLSRRGALMSRHYVFHGDGTFTPDDYQIVAAAEQIRNLSDYDDFYIASKESAVKQVENARKLVEKIRHATESLLC